MTSNSAWVTHRYTKEEVDWIAVYDSTSDQCFYLPSVIWDGQVAVSLRLTPTINGQAKGIRFAKDFTPTHRAPVRQSSTWPRGHGAFTIGCPAGVAQW